MPRNSLLAYINAAWWRRWLFVIVIGNFLVGPAAYIAFGEAGANAVGLICFFAILYSIALPLPWLPKPPMK